MCLRGIVYSCAWFSLHIYLASALKNNNANSTDLTGDIFTLLEKKSLAKFKFNNTSQNPTVPLKKNRTNFHPKTTTKKVKSEQSNFKHDIFDIIDNELTENPNDDEMNVTPPNTATTADNNKLTTTLKATTGMFDIIKSYSFGKIKNVYAYLTNTNATTGKQKKNEFKISHNVSTRAPSNNMFSVMKAEYEGDPSPIPNRTHTKSMSEELFMMTTADQFKEIFDKSTKETTTMKPDEHFTNLYPFESETNIDMNDFRDCLNRTIAEAVYGSSGKYLQPVLKCINEQLNRFSKSINERSKVIGFVMPNSERQDYEVNQTNPVGDIFSYLAK